MGYLYEKYKLKQEWDETIDNNDMIHKFLLKDSLKLISKNPIL